MLPIFKYILLIGIRDKLYLGLLISLIAAFSISLFLGNTALIEQQQMSAAYIAGSSRAILAIGMILFVCLNISRAFENKEVEFILSKSISRQQFVMGYLLGFFAAAFLILVPLLIALYFTVSTSGLGLLVWSSSLLLEILIVISFSLSSSLILKNSFLAIMASFSFYLISRLMGMFVLAINLPETVDQAKNNFLDLALKILSALFPRLDLFTQSSWLNYEITDFDNIKIILIQSAIYIPPMIFMGFHDFRKKQF